MTRLSDLRKRLARLRRRRRRVRLGTGLSAVLLLAVFWMLAAAFLVDWFFEMNRLQRLISLAVVAVIVIWAFRRFTVPWLGHRETDLDMALLVERQEHIDSDLIAAVQFESPEAAQWGSVQLEQAVIDRVATTSKRLHVMRGLSRKQLYRRVLLLLLTAGVWAAVGYRYTDHVSAFFNRLFLLSSLHYPTETIIESILVKSHEVPPGDQSDPDQPPAAVDWTNAQGRPVDPVNPGETPVKILYGHRVRFEVKCSGELPGKGRAELAAARSGLRKTIELQRLSGDSPVYVGELEQLREEVRYQLYLGDAWTDAATLTVTQLPVIDVELEVRPPPYAVTDEATRAITMPQGLRQVSVIEGSRVLVKIRTDSSLQGATLTVVDRTSGNQPYGFRKVESAAPDDPRELWVLDSEDSPLLAVTELIRYRIDVTDTDQQHLEHPILGVIRIQADAPPRIAAAVITRWVLPAARPTVYFHAIDDFGLARISIDAEVAHADGQTEQKQFEIYKHRPGQPPKRNLAPENGYPFDLSSLGLIKGDNVTITLRAVDFRGLRPGKSASSDPLVFQVTDEQGILASMMETDRHSARQLRTMIQRQLGIGESP